MDDAYYLQKILTSGSAADYKPIVERYQRQVFTLCYRIIRNREIAEEVTQDTFLKAFRKLPELKDHNKFPAWLRKIAYSKAIDFVRLKKVRTETIENIEKEWPTTENTPLMETASNNRRALIEKAISKLSSEEATIIHLFYLEDQSVKTTASMTGLSESNVKVKLMRAREKLREILTLFLNNELSDLY